MLQQEMPLSVVPIASATATQQPERATVSTPWGLPVLGVSIPYPISCVTCLVPGLLLKLLAHVDLEGKFHFSASSAPFLPSPPPMHCGYWAS